VVEAEEVEPYPQELSTPGPAGPDTTNRALAWPGQGLSSGSGKRRVTTGSPSYIEKSHEAGSPLSMTRVD